MLKINQRLDKLAAMQSKFTAHGMLLAGYSLPVVQNPSPQQLTPEDGDREDDNEGLIEGDNVLGHVVLAQTHGVYISLSLNGPHFDPLKHITTHRTLNSFLNP
jgi:hypothetical protein